MHVVLLADRADFTARKKTGQSNRPLHGLNHFCVMVRLTKEVLPAAAATHQNSSARRGIRLCYLLKKLP